MRSSWHDALVSLWFVRHGHTLVMQCSSAQRRSTEMCECTSWRGSAQRQRSSVSTVIDEREKQVAQSEKLIDKTQHVGCRLRGARDD
jgi:hypothetical protein